MIYFKKEILRIISVAIFSAALLLPTAVKLAHSFEGHQHETCTDISVHIHEKQLECSICDFHFSIFNFTPAQQPDFKVFHSFQNSSTDYVFAYYHSNPNIYFLRGPPLFS
ncbi:hypothetical protein QRD02_06320 [Aequorivita sp. SDUM287046]|uniref:DUF2946 domain-containing protein n=1 Tax=Aequorivita aurantiaca TaxID=3053356 RepID=A0ABT8DF71_9FLAO|nr:hypothetical protein [Aequorivita aurantiaca]MDN3723990.1 hypothetical protein [Aequorivita aurantiaca]